MASGGGGSERREEDELGGKMEMKMELEMEREDLLLLGERREKRSEMEAGGKDHLCGDWSPGPTAQCWLSFNPPLLLLLPPQRRRDTR